MKRIKRGIAFCLVIMLLMGIAFDNGFAMMDQVKAADEATENMTAEPVVDEESVTEEPVVENPEVTEEVVPEETTVEEPVAEEAITEQPTEEAIVEEVAPEQPEEKKQEALQLKQEIQDDQGQTEAIIFADIKEDTFDANSDEVTMKVSKIDAELTDAITRLANEKLTEEQKLGSFFLYKVEFQVNGITVEPGREVKLTFQPRDYKVDDVKKANVFYYNEAYSPAGNQAEEIVEIPQKTDKMEELQNAGASIENIDEEYDLTEITLHSDGKANEIVTEGRRSTVYGCYLEEQKPIENKEEVKENLKTLTYKNKEVTINVSEVKEGAIPKNAELKVVPIKKDDKDTKEQYAEVEKQVQEKVEKEKKELGGFLAYDITFVDAEGNKLEPNSEVKVTIEYNDAAKPNVEKSKEKQTAEVSVLHLEEDKKGNVKEVVDMNEAGQLDTLQTTDSGEVKKVEVRTESFSTFTITWEYSLWEQLKVTAHYVYTDENGNLVEIPDSEMDGKKPQNIKIDGEKQTIDLTDSKYRVEIPGYTYKVTRADGKDGASIIELYSTTVSRKGLFGILYTARLIQYKKNGDQRYTDWLDSDEPTEGHIYFIYEKKKPIVPGTITINDDIVKSGAIEAIYTPKAEETAGEYIWFRADSKTGTYEEVEQIRYQGDKSNLSEDGQFLYPAYDTGARKWYKVKATLSDGETVESEPFQVPYYDELQNGSFENPNIGSNAGSNKQYTNTAYKNEGGVWQSTGIGTGDNGPVSIEIVHEGQGSEDGYSWYKTWKDATPEGEQFSELNAQAAGALYQDVLTMEGTPLNYSLLHRARGARKDSTSEFDTMYLVMMPTKEAKDNDLTTQAKLREYLLKKEVNIDKAYNKIGSQQLYDSEGIRIIRITSDDQNWQRFNGTGYVPTASLTRFFFVAGATASGRSTVGNFLDDVGFSQKLPEVSDEEFTLQITKNFAGLDNTAMQTVQNNIKFVISAKEGDKELSDAKIEKLFGKKEITRADMIEDAAGSLIYTLANQKIAAGKEYEVTITEQQAEVDGYSLTAEAEAQIKKGETDSTKTGTDSVTFTLTGKTIADVTFNNNYLRSENKTINFTKVWDDADNVFITRPESLVVTLVPTIEVVENGKLTEKTLTSNQLGIELTKTLKAKDDWKTSWEVPVYYSYNDAKVLIHYTVTEGENTSDYVYEAASESAVEGDGSEYDKVFDRTSITEPTVKAKAARATAKMNSASTAAVENGDGTELGAPTHNKYVEYNKADGNYTLNLDVTGATGEATGVDVLFVIDTSGSMADYGLLRNVKSLLTENGVIDQIFKTEGNVNSVAYVSFAGMDETRVSDWYTSSNKADLEKAINRLRATGGTNWTYAMEKASETLAKRANNKNEKVVIFLSDGEPTYSMGNVESWWGGTQYTQIGSGSSTKSSYYTDAADRVNKSTALKNSKFYSVYLNRSTQSGMSTFNNKLNIEHHELKNGVDLSTALNDILQVIIPAYENVEITDTLSQYVDFVDGNITVTKRSANGTVTTLNEGSDYTLEKHGKTVCVRFTGKLDDGATYTVSTTIKPNETANEYYAKNSGYPEGSVGEAGTGITSAGKAGFYSNEKDSAKVTYTVNKKVGESAYPMPVVQVLDHTLKFEKKWNQPSNVNVPVNEVTIKVTYTDGTSENLTLAKANEWKLEKRVPITKKIGTVEELTELTDYEPSYQIATDRKSAIITNNYAKITTQTIEVVKNWVGENAPKSDVKVALYQSKNSGNPVKYKEAILSENNNWKITWKDVPLEDTEGSQSVSYTYAVREENVPAGYSSSISYDYQKEKTVVTITNTYDPNCASESYYIANVLQTDKITVDKKWEDNNDALQTRPESLNISVDNGQGDTYEVELNRENNWHKELTILEKKNASYDAKEPVTVENYLNAAKQVTQTGNGAAISFTNTISTKSIIVKKVWHDNDLEDRPTGIRFTIEYSETGKNDWKPYGTFNLLKDDRLYDEAGNSEPWAKEISNLKVGYDYRVIENVEGCGNYTSKVAVTTDDKGRQVFTIENTLNWKLVKTNLPSGEQNPMYLSGAKFTLKNEAGEQVATGISEKDGVVAWTWVETVKPAELNGAYTLKETESPAGYQLLDTEWMLTFENGLLKSVVGDNNKYGKYISASQTAENGFVITLKNDVLYELPQSGGTGIYWYLFGGMLLMMAASLVVYKKRRREVLERK